MYRIEDKSLYFMLCFIALILIISNENIFALTNIIFIRRKDFERIFQSL